MQALQRNNLWRIGLVFVFVGGMTLLNIFYLNDSHQTIVYVHPPKETFENITVEIRVANVTSNDTKPNDLTSEYGFPSLNVSITDCNDTHHLAIIIPFRDRKPHLESTLTHF